MSAIEQELIDKIRQLDDTQKIRVLEFVQEIGKPTPTPEDWFERVEAFQAELRARHGSSFRINVQELLDEVREERLDDLLGSR